MKAWVLHDINNFTYEECDKPSYDDNQVLVKVEAAGICGSDIPRVFQTGAHVKPIIIGHEFAGKVVETKPEDEAEWLYKRVGVFPLIPCRQCGPCRNKQYEMCRSYNYLGSRCNGGFAEYVAVPKANLIELPENVTYEQAAMLEPMAVAVHSMRRGFDLVSDKDLSGINVVVCGLGTIGLLLVMFLKQAGVKNILAIGNKDFQRKQIIDIGIEAGNYCDIKTESVKKFIDAKTEGCGADLFFECVGKNETVSQAIEAAAPAGGIVLVGNPYSDMHFDRNTYWKLLRSQLKVTGTWNSSFTHSVDDDWHYAVERLANGSISPERLISHRYDMGDLMEGFIIMRDKFEDYVKVMGLSS